MGIYLNPGKGRFQTAINSQIYVDKTDLIAFLNSLVDTKQRYLCVSRPRRFGKTTTMDMLSAYYGIGAPKRFHPRRPHADGLSAEIGISYDKKVKAGRPNYKHHSCRMLRACGARASNK